ncbi:hypothetical protein [Novosphingobium sp.]|uniref:hypothetical protein n=1 Tax=Novosphingobium sp. TaxID=1874826 RepID=UPI00286E11D8|nr:hypothetical protein [Novosphingobium sp.]
MTDEALARQIGAQMAKLHRVSNKLCELLTEASVRLEQSGQISSVEAVIEPKED